MTDNDDVVAAGTHHEWCGAEFERDMPLERDMSPATPRTPAEAAHGEPVTRCEWCGAAYPVPDQQE